MAKFHVQERRHVFSKKNMLSETIGHATFLAWLCYITVLFKWGAHASTLYAWKNVHGLSEPVRKELLSQWVWNARKIKCLFFVFFFWKGFVILATGLWVHSLSSIKLLGFCDCQSVDLSYYFPQCFEWYPSLVRECFQQGFHSSFRLEGNWFNYRRVKVFVKMNWTSNIL